MARRERPLFPLLVAVLVVTVAAAESDWEMSVHLAKKLPATAAVMNMTSPSVCGCRVRCLTVDFCTAVTAHKGPEGVTCVMTNATQPENMFVSHESAVSFAKGSGAGGNSSGHGSGQSAETTGTYFVSTARSNDGSHTEYFCTQEGGTPASLSDAQSLAELKTSDAEDGITDINNNGIWVFVKNDANGNKVFFNDQPVNSSSSLGTLDLDLDLAVLGECMRLRANNVLSRVACADLTGNFAFACFK